MDLRQLLSIDVKRRPDGSHSVFHSSGLVDSNLSLDEAINLAVELHCGELFQLLYVGS